MDVVAWHMLKWVAGGGGIKKILKYVFHITFWSPLKFFFCVLKMDVVAFTHVEMSNHGRSNNYLKYKSHVWDIDFNIVFDIL